jgi:hypothetical protein
MELLIYEAKAHTFIADSRETKEAIDGLDDHEWQEFVIASEVFETSTGRPRRPPGIVIEEVEAGLSILDTHPFGGARGYVCATRGSLVVVLVVGRKHRRIGKREIDDATRSFKEWRRRNPSRRADARS